MLPVGHVIATAPRERLRHIRFISHSSFLFPFARLYAGRICPNRGGNSLALRDLLGGVLM